jgi:hypothetical protein
MNITNDCVECIVNQISRATDLLNCDETLSKEIHNEVIKRSKYFSKEHTPPFVAKDVYEYLSKKTNMLDPLEEIKQDSIKTALEFVPFINKKINTSNDKLFTAIKASVAGNVIDFGAKEQFSLENEIQNVFNTNFAINDYELLKNKLECVDRLMIIADNSGENVFDKILLETIKNLYPHITLYYATRGKPIINDITTKEAIQIGIDKIANVVDSGVDTPGLETSRASVEFLDLYKNIPLIIAKGMGNFECLESKKDKKIFFLFKVKCNVVSNAINKDIGSIILKNG